jgi:hypothetical protein
VALVALFMVRVRLRYGFQSYKELPRQVKAVELARELDSMR